MDDGFYFALTTNLETQNEQEEAQETLMLTSILFLRYFCPRVENLQKH